MFRQVLILLIATRCTNLQTNDNSTGVEAASTAAQVSTHVNVGSVAPTTAAFVSTTTTSYSSAVVSLIDEYCQPNFNMSGSIVSNCYQQQLSTYLPTCKRFAAFDANTSLYKFWALKSILMPLFVYGYRVSAAGACLGANVSSSTSAQLVYEYCSNNFASNLFSIVQSMLSAFIYSEAFLASSGYSRVINTFHAFYPPISAYFLYATLLVLHAISKSEKNFNSIHLFYAEAVASSLSYGAFYLYNFNLLYPIFSPLCFASPMVALNLNKWIRRFQGSTLFPALFCWCCQNILHLMIAVDRYLAVRKFMWYKANMTKKLVKKCIAVTTLIFAFLCCMFAIAWVLCTVYCPVSVGNLVPLLTLSAFIFGLVFSVGAFVPYTVLTLNLYLALRKKNKSVALQGSSNGPNWNIVKLVLIMYIVNSVTFVCEVFFFLTEQCGYYPGCLIWLTFPPPLLVSGVGYFAIMAPFVIELGSVVNFLLQCILSQTFRGGAKVYMKSMLIAKCCTAFKMHVASASSVVNGAAPTTTAAISLHAAPAAGGAQPFAPVEEVAEHAV